MKKYLFIIVMCLFAFNAMAQVEHMKFMGIPLDGTIDTFQKKLEAKGVKYDKQTSSIIPVGCRVFSGRFASEDATIFVYYDERTKVVYRAKAVLSFYSRDIVKTKYSNFKYQLEQKYPQADITEDKYENEDSSDFHIPFLGSIDLYQSTNYSNYNNPYSLHIDYYDLINYVDHNDNELEDL